MKWFPKESAARRLPSTRRLSSRPGLEQLEDRRLLAVTYHGGPLLRHVGVEAAFYGRYWNSDAGLQQASDLNNYLGFLVNSSYMDMLGEYGVGRGKLVDNGIVNASGSFAQTVDDTAIRHMLDRDIADGFLQPPDPNRLYVIFTAPNVKVTLGNEDSVHNFFGYHEFFTDSAGDQVYYAVIPHPVGNGRFSNLDDFQTLTEVVSHELAEAVTDPAEGGWYDGRTGDEIGDLCNGPHDIGYLNGYVVQGEWSARLGACVLPADAQGVDSVFASAEPSSAALSKVANAFTHSDEYFANLVNENYRQLLHRTPSAAEVNSWVGQMKNGLTDEQVLAAFTASPEYYLRAGGTEKAWLDALYRDVLGRAPDASGEAAWLKTLASGASRFSVAFGLAASPEHESIVVTADYQRYLGRSAEASEVAGWVNNLQKGLSNEQVVAGFVASDEFYFRHEKSIQGWLKGAYQVILGRASDPNGFNYWEGYLRSTLASG